MFYLSFMARSSFTEYISDALGIQLQDSDLPLPLRDLGHDQIDLGLIVHAIEMLLKEGQALERSALNLDLSLDTIYGQYIKVASQIPAAEYTS